MQGGNHRAKQLDCTTSITSNQNNGIHPIHFGQLTTFKTLNRLGSKQKCGQDNIWNRDCTTSIVNLFYQQMPSKSYSRNLVSGSVMTFWMKLIHISSAHYTTGLLSNVYCFFWHISHFSSNVILNLCSLCSGKFTEYTVCGTLVNGHTFDNTPHLLVLPRLPHFWAGRGFAWLHYCIPVCIQSPLGSVSHLFIARYHSALTPTGSPPSGATGLLSGRGTPITKIYDMQSLWG